MKLPTEGCREGRILKKNEVTYGEALDYAAWCYEGDRLAIASSVSREVRTERTLERLNRETAIAGLFGVDWAEFHRDLSPKYKRFDRKFA